VRNFHNKHLASQTKKRPSALVFGASADFFFECPLRTYPSRHTAQDQRNAKSRCTWLSTVLATLLHGATHRESTAAKQRSRLPCVLLPALVNRTILLRIAKQQTNIPPHRNSTKLCSATKRQNAKFVLSDRDTAPTRSSQATATYVQSLATRGRQIPCVKFGPEHAVPFHRKRLRVLQASRP